MTYLKKWEPEFRSVLRIMCGLLFLEHGLQKLLHFPPAAATAKAMGDAPWFVQPAGCIELVGGVLIVIGLFTSVSALICSGEMAFAYFLVHAPRGFYPLNNGGDAAILYCFVFLYFVFAGPGPFSLDALIKRERAVGA